MFRNKLVVPGLILCGAFAALASTAEACVPDSTRGPIRVSVGEDKMPVVTPDSVTVCEGETLRWVFQGSDARAFSVIFVNADQSPFDWDRQTGATVTGTVKAGSAKNGEKTEYKYDVEVDGQRLDPRIIVEN
jgi:plastocyanin